MLNEQAVAEVILVDERAFRLLAARAMSRIHFSCCWLHFARARVQARVVERVDIYGKSLGMLGEFG